MRSPDEVASACSRGFAALHGTSASARFASRPGGEECATFAEHESPEGLRRRETRFPVRWTTFQLRNTGKPLDVQPHKLTRQKLRARPAPCTRRRWYPSGHA